MLDPAKPYDLHFPVTPIYIDWRLDNFVKAMVPSMSRTKIQRYCALQKIFVNDRPCAQNWRVRLNDRVLLSCREPENLREITREIAARLPTFTIYEDDDIIAINKPAGLIVHPAGRHRHDTLLNALYFRYRDILPPDAEIALANRLDQFTSGLILAAKSVAAKRHLQEQFENRKVRKIYYALTIGEMANPRGEIDLPLGPLVPGKSRLQAVRNDELGKAAFTEYKVLERFAPKSLPEKGEKEAAKMTAQKDDSTGVSLVKLFPHTGRQHQLRVHLTAIGYPLVADEHYGSGKIMAFTDDFFLRRCALHAAELNFTHPRSGESLTLTAPFADDFAATLTRLRAAESFFWLEKPTGSNFHRSQ